MVQIEGGMAHPGVPHIGEERGMSQTAVRMMQIPGWRAGDVGRMAREPAAVRQMRSKVFRKEG
jgi:hypothetical protein